jgi:formylglycine-generating enzyme required for sulfatase activity
MSLSKQQVKFLQIFLLCFIALLNLTLLSLNGKAQEAETEFEPGAVVVDRLGFEMVYVPSGIVEMGITHEDLSNFLEQGALGDIPESQFELLMNTAQEQGVFDIRTMSVPAFWIDRYEVTIGQYQSRTEECVGTGRCATADLSELPQLTADSNQPQIGVPWFDALRFCIGRDARLPTEAEWEYAASGPGNLIFPWGNRVNTNNLTISSPTYPVGSKSGNVSWVGVYDLAGNASEWVEDRIQLYDPSEPETLFVYNNQTDVYRVVRGGSYQTTIFSMTSFARDAQNPASAGEGFRCARSNDPRG